jgi:hypothetical protein
MRAAIFFLIASALVVMTVEVSADKDGELSFNTCEQQHIHV